MISKIENMISLTTTPDCMSRAVTLRKPSRGIYALPAVGTYPLGANDNQPHIMVGVLGGAKAGRGLALVDSGACCTMITEGVAERHGLKMQPHSATFT